MTLYEMNSATKALYELLQNEEIDEQTFNDTLEAIGVEQKIQSYCEIIKQMQADEVIIIAELARLAQRKKTISNAIDRMKNVLKDHLSFRGEKKINTGLFTVSLSESKAVDIVSPELIPKKYLVPQEPKIDKSSIKAAIASGIDVPGAVIIANQGVRIK